MIISINQCNDICRVQDPRSPRHLPQRNTTGNRWGRGVDKEVCPRRSDLPRGTECARRWGEMTASHFKFPLKTDTYTLCYQIKFFVFVFFLSLKTELNKCTCGFPVFLMWLGGPIDTYATHLSLHWSQGVNESMKVWNSTLHYYWVKLILHPPSYAPTSSYKPPNPPDHFQIPLLLWLLLFFS